MKSDFKILLVEDMESFRGAVVQMLGVYNDVDEAASVEEARKKLQTGAYDVVLLDKGLPDGDGKSLISEVKSFCPNTVIIVLTSDSDFTSVKHCIALGADDYVIKSDNIIPDLLVRIPVVVSKAASQRRLKNLDQQVKEAFKYEIVGKSPQTMDLREEILSLKGSSANVFISGESGTGKELIARRINAIEDDMRRPFVAINCGAIPENLIESELFGHKKGSFTGATQDKPGRFELAHGGDIFLDEIGEMPLSAQVRLLRVLQEYEVTRVGDTRPIKVDCRVIAATNKNIEEMVANGTFREDLYHRLNVVRMQTAPLRERMTDIDDLAKLFVLQVGGPNFKITDTALKALKAYDWPGNVRELRNAIERAIISVRRGKATDISYDDISVQASVDTISYRMRKIEASLPSDINALTPENYDKFFELIGREYFKSALEAVNGDASELAQLIGVSRSTVFNKLKSLGLSIRELNRKKKIARTSKWNTSNQKTMEGYL
ncbi:MAG: sigma-54-dependent Fis family transcriptional regulator [Bdellovibrionales bacterium]|nr:sigma-54-dependent Fis family transcriptional regulator [Bdellovibrionales bacterium]